MKTISIALMLACLALGQPARADPMASDSAVLRIIFDQSQNKADPNVPTRSAIADAVLSFWRDFDSKIPRNSPAVTEWLTKELTTTDMERINRVTSTPEYALQELSTLTDDCLSDAALLKQSIGKTTVSEMYAWMRLSGCYGNPHAIEIHLKTASLSKGLYDGPITMVHANLLHSFIAGRIANSLVRQPDPH
ncbi:hypothetical protein [Rhizobium leguminosarum]|uniref:hypothetical protein n=1 Tax=Rhizobium leguminosarum TaxID=384 RepID=UPI001441E7BE|nr:hypothetical protein [Rhizobium leguminosarum]NKK41688.1 hypothetical protein [Rhizobium leguminosarum bv. viciae]